MKVTVVLEKFESGFKATIKSGVFSKKEFADKSLDSLLKTVNEKVKKLMGAKTFGS
jgi:hypothetical protein